MRAAWDAIARHVAPDAVVLVDGGTDVLMRGDEAGRGTPVEDMTRVRHVPQDRSIGILCDPRDAPASSAVLRELVPRLAEDGVTTEVIAPDARALALDALRPRHALYLLKQGPRGAALGQREPARSRRGAAQRVPGKGPRARLGVDLGDAVVVALHDRRRLERSVRGAAR